MVENRNQLHIEDEELVTRHEILNTILVVCVNTISCRERNVNILDTYIQNTSRNNLTLEVVDYR